MGKLYSFYGKSWYKALLFVLLTTSNFEAFSQADEFLTYEELQRLENEALSNENLEKLRKLSQIHVSKARKENNGIEVARGHYYRVVIEEPDVAMAYSDSIILATNSSNHLNYPTLGYILKGHLHYGSGNFQEALDNFLKAYNLALKKGNDEHQREISIAIAAIRNVHGQHSAAADLYRRSLDLLKKKKDYDITHYDEFITLLYNLSLTHLRMFQLDSADLYVSKGIRLSNKSNDGASFQDFVLVDAQINYYRKDLKKAQDTLQKYVEGLEGTSKAIKLYYLGKISKWSNNDEQAAEYFRSVDSIVSATEDPFNEVKDVYHQLIVHSSLKNDKKKQIEYIEKLIHYDSLLSSQQQGVVNQAVIAYDIPYLKHQKEEAEEQLKIKGAAVNGIGVLALMAICSGIYFYFRSRMMRNRLNLLMESTATIQPVAKATIDHPPSVPADIREDILKKLEAFEKSELFLSKELDMSRLAEELGTNTTYLSTIVNHYKKMSFPNYMKDLKIYNAIKRLSEDPELLKYTYQGIAERFGFKTGESFSKAFYKKTGVYPSKFLSELRARKNSGHL